MSPAEDLSAELSGAAVGKPPAPLDVRTIEPLLMAQAAAGGCSWPWLIRFLYSLTRVVRTSARFFPPHRVEGDLEAQAPELSAASRALMDRQDDDLADAVRRDRKTISRSTVLNGEPIFQLATPLSGEGEPWGALILWVRPPLDRALEPFLVALQLVASFGQTATLRNEPAGGPQLAASLSNLSVHLGDMRDGAEAAQAFADQVVRLTGCDVAALALRRGGRWRVVTISGSARFDRAGTTAGAVSACLRELDAQGSVVPAPLELARQWDCRWVRPWFLDGKRPAAFLLGFRQQDAPGANLDHTLDAATPGWTSLMDLSVRLGAGGAARVLLGLLARPFVSVRWLLACLVVALLTAAMLQPVTHTIRVVARVEAADRRTISAPIDGTLRANHVVLGQAVEAGQLLGEMDDAEILIRLTEVRANRVRSRAQHAAIMSREDPDVAIAQLAWLDAEIAEIEIHLLEHRLGTLSLTAPISGTVLREPSRWVGARVSLGGPLYEIAAADAIRLELDVPDNRIAYLYEGQDLEVLIESYPGRTWQARITKLHPQAEVRDGANLFVAEALPVLDTPEWKPGMRGRATIQGERRVLGWILFHPVWEFVEWILF